MGKSSAGTSLTRVARDFMPDSRPEVADRVLRGRLAETPDDPCAWLLLGLANEDLGRNELARSCYLKALTKANHARVWIDDLTTPTGLRPLVMHATEKLARDRRELVESIFERQRVRYGRGELRRVEKALAIYLGDAKADYPDERQRPVFLFFPDIRVLPYYDPKEFDWVDLLESQTSVIKQELISVMAGDQNIELFFDEDRSPYKRLMPDWDAFFFFRYGHRYDLNHALCPKTSAVLEQLPLCHVANHAPETLFSFVAPRGRINPHCGVTNTRLVVHLPLLIPGPCALTVGGVEHRWREGEVVVFDDTFTHEARNDADARRALLLMDIWHPDLTEVERLALAEIMSAISDFGTSPVV
jgi:aspartate beta-hydroxylase